ncbi:hypothetical protein BBJ28_00018082 [Nothophytophthora sp. Chile5]|nr:hypothetical protein BBJ28_00018082 [Nothophytophthora sp. Chile5]
MGAADTATALEGASLPMIVATGLLLGVVHVLTGPDHLSALIVLSAGSSWRSCQLGMRWGCGHSTGLVLVTACFLAVNQQLDVDTFGSYCDFMVGFLMVGLGLWSLRHYWLLRRQLRLKHQPMGEATPLQRDAELGEGEESDSDTEIRKILHNHHLDHEGPSTSDGVDNDQSRAKTCCFGLCMVPTADIKNPRTQQLTAFAYGTAHGLAGTGGILGVLPAVILNDWAKSSAYLGSFCLASILIMGAFAALYGEVTGRMSRFSDASLVRVGVFSSCVAIAKTVAVACVDQTEIVSLIFHGDAMRFEGEVVNTGSSSLTVQMTGYRHDISTRQFVHAVNAVITLVALDEHLRPSRGLPPLVDPESPERAARLKTLAKQRKELSARWQSAQEAVDLLPRLIALGCIEQDKTALYCAKVFTGNSNMHTVAVERVSFKLPIKTDDMVAMEARVGGVR